MIRIRLPALAVTAAAFLFVSCSGSNTAPTKQGSNAPDPQWVSSISQHSNGAISRHAPIRVLFVNDVVPAERVGTDASANVTISPKVKAHARRSPAAAKSCCGRRPSFAPNTEYRVSIKAEGLTGVPADTKPFEFTVKT